MLQKLKKESKKDAKRTESAGVFVMQEKWQSSKAQRALIRADLEGHVHTPARRKKQTTDGYEEGILVVGDNTITFLYKDDKHIISSHPLSFLETYCVDPYNKTWFSYVLKEEKVLRKGEFIKFSFDMGTEDKAKALVSHLDHAIVRYKRLKEAEHGGEEYFFDADHRDLPARTGSTVAEQFAALEGERFLCDKLVVDYEKKEVIGSDKPVPVVCIMNAKGVFMLNQSDIKSKSNALEAHNWHTVKSFGAFGDEYFGLRVLTVAKAVSKEAIGNVLEGEVYIRLFAEPETLHLMETVAQRYVNLYRKE